MEEQPVYILKQSLKRALIPKITSFIVLGIIFYLGILINISLIGLATEEGNTVKGISLIILLIITIIGIYLSIKRAKSVYKFYRNRISFKKKILIYSNIINTKPKRDFLDKIFKTHSINLGNNFHLKHISNEINIESYLNQLVSYSKRS